MKIYDMQINHLKNPLGFKLNRTVFSWKVKEAKGKKQKAARILVTSDREGKKVVADTGFVKDLDSLGSKVDVKLIPRTRYYWTVTVQTDAGEEITSAQQWFETGKMEEKWNASWITCDNKTERHPKFIKKIQLKEKPVQVRLYICGLGLYEAYYDQKKIGDEYLTPYGNDYNSWVQYQTYDMTEMMQKNGEISVLLGNGWYKGRFGFQGKEAYYGNKWKLLAELRIVYQDGSEEVIGTDGSWNCVQSRITFSNLYDGEKRDDTLPESEKEKAILTDAPKGKLTDRMSLSVIAKKYFKCAEMIHTPAGEEVLDLKQEITGTFTLRVHEPAGKVIRIQTGEILQNGNFYNGNLRTAKSEYIYVSDGTEKVIHPIFTYYGYRYVKIEGVTDLKAKDFTGIAFYSDIEDKGFLETGHELLNKFLSNVRWGLRDNFVDIPTDCPQRDERMGWTGDAQVFAPTATYLTDTYAFFAKYLYDVWQEQKANAGMVPCVVPSYGLKNASSVWGDCACMIPWTLYTFYGDQSILEDQYESMKAWIEYIRKIDGDNHGWRHVFHYGDWLALDHPVQGPQQVMGGTDAGFIANIYYAYNAGILAKAAEILGKGKDAEEYKKLSRQQFEEVKKEYYSVSGRCCIRTQTAMLLTLQHNLSDNKELIKEQLRDLYSESHKKLKTGFVGTPIMCNVLSENGMSEQAYELLLNEEYPGWLREVKLGATTVWERWNSLLDDGTISGTGMNSMNHYSYGSVAEWIFRYPAGLNFTDKYPGCRRVTIAPVPNKALKYLNASYNSPAGLYKTGWRLGKGRRIEITVEIPFGCSAELVLPYAPEEIYKDKSNPMFRHVEEEKCSLSAGTYKVSYEMTQEMRKIYSTDSMIFELATNEKIVGFIEKKTGRNLSEIPYEFQHLTLRAFFTQLMAGVVTEEGLNQLERDLENM